jgi:hypothetical protein
MNLRHKDAKTRRNSIPGRALQHLALCAFVPSLQRKSLKRALAGLAGSTLVLFVNACNPSGEHPAENNSPQLSEVKNFVVAGHAYGNATVYTEFPYEPFVNKLLDFSKTTKISGLFLTGDVVARPDTGRWNSVKTLLDHVGVPWFIAPGNHDVSSYFLDHVQPSPYNSFSENGHLFLTLNTCFPGWTVDSLQKNFITENIAKVEPEKSIFVFSHQLWWLLPTGRIPDIDSVRPNSYAMWDSTASFWNDAWPLFSSLENETYFFAGDLGADAKIVSYYEDHSSNFHFFGSGMGGGIDDNFLVISVGPDDGVTIKRIGF